MRPDDALWELLYEEALRSLDQQAIVVDGIRSRTGLLIAAASVATALLAGPVLETGVRLSIVLLPLALFTASMALSLMILWPRHRWVFSTDVEYVGDLVVRGDITTIPRLRGYVLSGHQIAIKANDKKIRWLMRLFKWSAFALVLEVGAWIVALIIVH